MAKQSIESMYDLMFKMRDKMGEVLEDAQELVNAAKTYGGEISRIMTEQLTQYFGPTIQKLINGEKTPGSIIGLIRFMDSVPLSYTRMEPEADIVDPVDPEAPDNINIEEPASLNNDLDDLPRNASFAHPVENSEEGPTTEEVPVNTVEESASKKANLKEAVIYQVVRTSGIGSALGEDIAKLEDTVVAEFDTEEVANEKAEELNATVLPSEKDLLGTEYKVVSTETIPPMMDNTAEEDK